MDILSLIQEFKEILVGIGGLLLIYLVNYIGLLVRTKIRSSTLTDEQKEELEQEIDKIEEVVKDERDRKDKGK